MHPVHFRGKSSHPSHSRKPNRFSQHDAPCRARRNSKPIQPSLPRQSSQPNRPNQASLSIHSRRTSRSSHSIQLKESGRYRLSILPTHTRQPGRSRMPIHSIQPAHPCQSNLFRIRDGGGLALIVTSNQSSESGQSSHPNLSRKTAPTSDASRPRQSWKSIHPIPPK